MLKLFAVLTVVSLCLADPGYYGGGGGGYGRGGGGYGGYGGGHARVYAHVGPYGHNFGYDVAAPHYGNYQGRHETGHGGNVRGTYYLQEADGSTRRVDYVATHPGGFVATVTDRHGSRTYGAGGYGGYGGGGGGGGYGGGGGGGGGGHGGGGYGGGGGGGYGGYGYGYGY